MSNTILSPNEVRFEILQKEKKDAFKIACGLSNKLKENETVFSQIYQNSRYDTNVLDIVKALLTDKGFKTTLQKGCRDYSCDDDDYGPPYDSWTHEHQPGEVVCNVRHRPIYRLKVTL